MVLAQSLSGYSQIMAGPEIMSEAFSITCLAGKMPVAGSSSGLSLYFSVVSPQGLSGMGLRVVGLQRERARGTLYHFL